jgi:hypothetical protein
MKKFFLMTSAIAIAGCASRTREPTLTLTEPCAALADTVSKYVSLDALPLAHIVGSPRPPRAPVTLGYGDSATWSSWCAPMVWRTPAPSL